MTGLPRRQRQRQIKFITHDIIMQGLISPFSTPPNPTYRGLVQRGLMGLKIYTCKCGKRYIITAGEMRCVDCSSFPHK